MNTLERRVARLEAGTIAPVAGRFFAVWVRPGEDVDDVIARAKLDAGPHDTVMAVRFVEPNHDA